MANFVNPSFRAFQISTDLANLFTQKELPHKRQLCSIHFARKRNQPLFSLFSGGGGGGSVGLGGTGVFVAGGGTGVFVAGGGTGVFVAGTGVFVAGLSGLSDLGVGVGLSWLFGSVGVGMIGSPFSSVSYVVVVVVVVFFVGK